MVKGKNESKLQRTNEKTDYYDVVKSFKSLKVGGLDLMRLNTENELDVKALSKRGLDEN